MRPRPITMALASLMAAVLVVAALVMVHGRQRLETAADAPAPAAPSPPSRVPVAAVEADVVPTPDPPAPPHTPPEPEPAPPATATAPVSGDGDATEGEGPRARRPEVLLANHARRLAEADELAFTALQLAEDKRAAIRSINDGFNRRVAGDAPHSAAAETAARRDAIAAVLGREQGKDFDAAERTAIRRVRGRYRFEWGRQLRP